MEDREREIKTEIFRDNFQNYKKYGIPKAQLVIADIPYNLGVNAYGSNPQWSKVLAELDKWIPIKKQTALF
jgi:site-specific DNA-methyltransferase (adenine-specific)